MTARFSQTCLHADKLERFGLTETYERVFLKETSVFIDQSFQKCSQLLSQFTMKVTLNIPISPFISKVIENFVQEQTDGFLNN